MNAQTATWPFRLRAAVVLLGLAWIVSLLLALWDPTTDWGSLLQLLGRTPATSNVTEGFGFASHRSTPWDYGLGFTVLTLPILLAHLGHPRRWARVLAWTFSISPMIALLSLALFDVFRGKGAYYQCSLEPWLSPEGPMDQVLIALGYLGAITLFSLGLGRVSRRWESWTRRGVAGLLTEPGPTSAQ